MKHPSAFLLACLPVLGSGASAGRVGGDPSDLPATAPATVRADAPLARRAFAILDRRGMDARSDGEVVRDLVALGPDAVPVLFAILSGSSPTSTDADASGSTPFDPSPRAEIVLVEALVRFPSDRLDEGLIGACRDAALPVRLVALRILGRTGGGAGPEAWAAILEGVPSSDLSGPFAEGPIEASLASILARERSALDGFARIAKKLDPALVPAAARAVASSAGPRGMEALVRLLGDGAPPAVVGPIGELGEATGVRPPAWVLDRLRRTLGTGRLDAVRAAAAALARLGDADSCPALLEGLASPDAATSGACRAALARLAGGDPSRTPDEWRRWYDDETGWYDRHGRDLLLRLEDPDPVVSMDAVRRLCAHPLYRDPVSVAISAVLTKPDPKVARAAAVALGELGSRRAVPALVDALKQKSPAVREAARASLSRITGKDLPASEDAWRPALGLETP